jgi:hypothetical protein
MDNVHNLRDQHAGDVVVLITATGDACGRVVDIGEGATEAFAVVRWDCAIGNYSFAHEIGHLLGGRHDNDPNDNPFPYGHGFNYGPGNWRTVMSVNLNLDRIGYWSNPDVTLGGVPMGTASDHDNVRVWENRAGTVANFRIVNPPPAAPSNLVMTNAGQVNQNPQLDWDDNTEPDLDHYTVYRCPSHFQTCTWTAIGTPTSSSFTDFGVMITGSGSGDDEYRYYVSATDTGGEESSSSNFVSTWGTTPMLRGPTTSEAPIVPEDFALGASYPNPVRTQATIRYALPEAAHVTLTVYDVMGREVKRLVQSAKAAGFHETQVDASTLPSGTYLYRLRAGPFTQTQRMVVVR